MRRPAPRGFGRVEAAAWRDCHLRRQRDSRRSVRGQLRDRPHPHEGGRRASELTRARRPRCREYRDPNDAGVWSAAGRVSETRPSHASHLPSCSRGCSTPTAPAWLRVSDRNSVAASPGAVTRVLLLRGSRHPRSHGLTAAFWQRRSRSTGRNELDLRRGQAGPENPRCSGASRLVRLEASVRSVSGKGHSRTCPSTEAQKLAAGGERGIVELLIWFGVTRSPWP